MANSTTSTELLTGWAQLTNEINQALSAYARFGEGCPPELEAAMRYSLLGPGKRLRPLLALFAADALGGDQADAMPVACAAEMIHAYSLVHDDLPCMDDDELRRGRPTCHIQFGEATAVLVGDALIARAFEIIANDCASAEVARACCRELARAAGACNLVGGQSDDLHTEQPDQTMDRLLAIHRRKTGAMFLAPLRMGAITACRSTAPEAIDQYGQSLGLAFQIVDDLLDFEGDEAVVGKKTGKDAAKGKLTFPGLIGVDESRRRAEELVEEAVSAAASLGERSANLQRLARFVLERDR
ncbi:MAG: polyprenyl synthetase family protein [Planctomycetota bacterium]